MKKVAVGHTHLHGQTLWEGQRIVHIQPLEGTQKIKAIVCAIILTSALRKIQLLSLKAVERLTLAHLGSISLGI